MPDGDALGGADSRQLAPALLFLVLHLGCMQDSFVQELKP